MSFKRNFPVSLSVGGVRVSGRFQDPPSAAGRCRLLVPVPGVAVEAVRRAYCENSYVSINDGGECSIALVSFVEVADLCGVAIGMTIGLRLTWDPSMTVSAHADTASP